MVTKPKKAASTLYHCIRDILESARANVARTVNTTQVVANRLIGCDIVEKAQAGKRRAVYGAEQLRDLATRLRTDFGSGYGVDNLELFRRSYIEYPQLLSGGNSDALRRNSGLLENSDYVNYYDRERCTKGDNSTLGLILCPDKNDAVVRYTLGEQLKRNIFTSRRWKSCNRNCAASCATWRPKRRSR